MEITEREAQLILNALAWENYTWSHDEDFNGYVSKEIIAQARKDFVDFCRQTGIVAVVSGC